MHEPPPPQKTHTHRYSEALALQEGAFGKYDARSKKIKGDLAAIDKLLQVRMI